jgi:GH35 family endo-1,4-beta-xylanase
VCACEGAAHLSSDSPSRTAALASAAASGPRTVSGSWGSGGVTYIWRHYLPPADNRTNRPLLFNTAGAPKPAFWAIADPAYVIVPGGQTMSNARRPWMR